MTRRRPSRVRDAILAALLRADDLTQADLVTALRRTRTQIRQQLCDLLRRGEIVEARSSHERCIRYRLVRREEEDHA